MKLLVIYSICMAMDIITIFTGCNLLFITVQISHCQDASAEIHCLLQQRILLKDL